MSGFFLSRSHGPARRCKVSSTLLANVIQPITSFCLHCFLRRAGRFHGRPNGDVPRLVLATTEFQLQLQAELLADGAADVVATETAAYVATSGTATTATARGGTTGGGDRRRRARLGSGGRRGACTAAARCHLPLAIFVDRELTFGGDWCHRFRSGQRRVQPRVRAGRLGEDLRVGGRGRA